MKNIFSTLILSVLFSSCSVALTKKGEIVRTITADQKQHCKYLGTITESSESGWNASGDMRNALNYVKNEAAKLNGNAIFILSNTNSTSVVGINGTIVGGSEAVIQAESYSCLFKETTLKPI